MGLLSINLLDCCLIPIVENGRNKYLDKDSTLYGFY